MKVSSKWINIKRQLNLYSNKNLKLYYNNKAAVRKISAAKFKHMNFYEHKNFSLRPELTVLKFLSIIMRDRTRKMSLEMLIEIR